MAGKDDSGMEEHVDLFESDEEEEPADPKLDGVVGFVLDKLAAFGERLEGLETKVGKLEQQQTPPPASKMAKMASIFGPGTSMTSTPMATKKPRAEAVFKPPETPDDVQDEQLRAALKDVWLPGPRSRTELLTDAQQRYVCYFLAHAGPATGNKGQVERLLFAGRKDGMWCADWTPPGGKVDLFTHLKNKLKGMRSMEAMESRYQKSIAERRSQSRDDTN